MLRGFSPAVPCPWTPFLLPLLASDSLPGSLPEGCSLRRAAWRRQAVWCGLTEACGAPTPPRCRLRACAKGALTGEGFLSLRGPPGRCGWWPASSPSAPFRVPVAAVPVAVRPRRSAAGCAGEGTPEGHLSGRAAGGGESAKPPSAPLGDRAPGARRCHFLVVPLLGSLPCRARSLLLRGGFLQHLPSEHLRFSPSSQGLWGRPGSRPGCRSPSLRPQA